jgi:outer membrane protein OmpA-like peptidoglycan-associated protein
MNRQRYLLMLFLSTLIAAAPAAHAQLMGQRTTSRAYTVSEGYPFFGVDLGVVEPTNNNFRANVQTGGSGSPFVGYMFNDWFGLQSNLTFNFWPPDNDHFNGTCTSLGCQVPKSQGGVGQINHENGYTTMVGLTAGPRVVIPISDLFDFYTVAQGGGFKAMGGRVNQWAPGFSLGGGLDLNLTENLSVGAFGRWNRAYMSPHPYILVGQQSDQNGPDDVQWASAGVSIKWSFKKAAPPPPPPPPPVAQAPPPPPPTKEKIVLRAVHFDFNKATIRPDAQPILDEAVRMLKERGEVSVIVEGHTDSIGSDAYNMKLSMRRADAVKRYLVEHGIAASRITTEGFGKRQPVASNATAEGRAQNRRVELRVR